MTRFSLGIFVDAHHVLEADRKHRSARMVLDRIETAAAALCMAGGVSHGVVVADCADPEARQVAEDFGDQGFRIRHVPTLYDGGGHQVLAAEIMEAMTTRPEIRAVAVVGEQSAYLPLADSLHRTGCALIGCTAGATARFGGVDDLITLPLSGRELRELIRKGLEELAEQGTVMTSIAGLENAMRLIDPGYTSRAYNVTVKRVLTLMREPWFKFSEPDRIVIEAGARTAGSMGDPDLERDPREDKTPAAKAEARDHSQGSRSEHPFVDYEMVMAACRELPGLGTDSDLGATVGALRAVLDVFAKDSALRAAALNGGIPLPAVAKGLSVVAPQYKRVGRPIDLCQSSIQGTSWTIWRNPDKSHDVRLRLAPPARSGVVFE